MIHRLYRTGLWMLPVVALLAALTVWGNLSLQNALLIGVAAAGVFLLGSRPPAQADVAAAIFRLDQTARARLATLARAVQTSEAILETLPDAVVTLNAQRQILRCNRAARRLFEVPPIGRDLVTVVRHPSMLEAVDAVLAGGGARCIDVPVTDPSAQEYRVDIRPLAAADTDDSTPPDGAPSDGTAAVLVWHDVTASRRSERMRGDFVANASHELRTPLASLTGFIETLRGPARDDPEIRDQFLEIMAEQAQRMARLVEDLMSLSSIEMKEHERPIAQVALAPLVDHVLATMAQAAAKRNITLVREVAPELPAVIGNGDEITQVLHNLIDNALKYGNADSCVTLSCALAQAPRAAPAHPILRAASAHAPRAASASANAWVAIAVRDQGNGIAREHLPRLTERFYRVDAARSRAAGGTGLGLAIVKHIVNRHRGALVIDSEIGRGSIVTVTLPAADPFSTPLSSK